MRKLLALLILIATGGANAATLTLTWEHDPADGSGTTEYRLYSAAPGQEFNEASFIPVAPAASGTVHQTTITAPKADMSYAVTAANATDESEYSNTVTYVYKKPPVNLNFTFRKK